jgi:UDP-GlcNAc:undecaprenyl-phosphate GlcNAc-1-phosphate transferase
MYLGFAGAIGFAVWAGAWTGLEAGQRHVLGIFVGATAIALLGALDDRFEVPAVVKLIGQIGCAALLIPFGVMVAGISNPFAGTWIAFPVWVGWLVTIGWVVAITNAINLIDGLDGLAAGICGIASFSLAVFAAAQGQVGPAVIAAAVCGATLGFLPYNFHPARVFMGDLGSHFLGFTIASIAVIGAFKIAASMAILLPLLVLAVPIFDTAFAIARRYRRRQPIFQGDTGHLHHRLLAKGLTQAQTVLVIYAIAAVFCFLAYLVSRLR